MKRPSRVSRGWLALGLAATAVVLALFALGLALRQGPATPTSDTYRALLDHRITRADIRAESVPPSVLRGAPPAPVPVALTAPVDRIRIPRIGVDAALVTLNLAPTGEMASPDGPSLVAWYDFTGKPGAAGNAVFSGHVDYVNHGPAVFWDLRKLEPGDRIEVRLQDGSELRYVVTASHLYTLADIPMGEVLAPTSAESVTLITCGGTFKSGEYSHRLVVRAIRTDATSASAR